MSDSRNDSLSTFARAKQAVSDRYGRSYVFIKESVVTPVFGFGKKSLLAVLTRMESVLFGEMFDFVKPPIASRHKSQLEKAALESKEGVAIKKFGLLGGSLTYFVPSSHQQVTKLLKQLDHEPKGRYSYAAFDYLTNGTTLLADTGPLAAEHHRLVTQNFNLENLAQITVTRVLQAARKNERTLVKEVVREILAEALLGVENFPEDLHVVIDILADNGLEAAAFSMPRLFQFYQPFREAQKKYDSFATKFLQNYITPLEQACKSYPIIEKRNLIISSVLAEIKRDYANISSDPEKFKQLLNTLKREQLEKYLQRPAIKGIPSILVGGENLISLLGRIIIDFRLNRVRSDELKKFLNLKSELDSAALFVDETIDARALHSLTQLDQMYKSELSRGLVTDISRYSEKGIPELKIPANSMVVIAYDALKNSELSKKEQGLQFEPHQFPYYPFSTGPRMCPGVRATETICKAWIATMVRFFEWTDFGWQLKCKPGEEPRHVGGLGL